MISPDLPIKEASEDLLNRTKFAESLAYAIQKYDNPNFLFHWFVWALGKWEDIFDKSNSW